MANGRRGRRSKWTRGEGPEKVKDIFERMHGERKPEPPKDKLSKTAREVIEQIQASPHKRFVLPRKEMERAIANEEIRRKIMKRLERIPKWKRGFKESVARATEMDYQTIENEMKKQDELAKKIYRNHKKYFEQLYYQAKNAQRPNSTFLKFARYYLVASLNISQIEQHRHAFEMVKTFHDRQQIDPQVMKAYEKVVYGYAKDEAICQNVLRNDVKFGHWVAKEFNRLKKL